MPEAKVMVSANVSNSIPLNAAIRRGNTPGKRPTPNPVSAAVAIQARAVMAGAGTN
jgi:hypothetical protein